MRHSKRGMTLFLLGLLIVCGLVGAAVALRITYAKYQQEKWPGDPPIKNRLQWFVKKAKANGETEVNLSPPEIEYLGSATKNLSSALSNYTAVIAEPIERHSYIENNEDIVTWYKFKIVDVLSEKTSPACPACPVPEPPREFLTVSNGEFVTAQIGGTVFVDNIKVSMVDPNFPQFEIGKKYLLFITKYPSGVAQIGIGPNGVFEVDDSGEVKGINRRSHVFKDDIERNFGNSITRIKNHAQMLKNIQ